MKLVLVDGSGFIFRAFHAIPDMQRDDGVHVNAVFGFCNMLARLLKDHTGTHLAVIFDAGRKTFRDRIYGQYKAHRPPPPPELVPQFALIREATKAFGVPAIELEDWEADDLIAAYAKAAREEGGEVVIVSSDKDLMQLLRDGVEMLDPMKNTPIGLEEVAKKFGVTPDKVIEVQALIGDSVDNVPGVPGIGPKGAAALIDEYGTLEKVLEAAPSMKPSKRRESLIDHAEAARLSKQLVTLRDDAPLPVPVNELGVKAWDAAVLRAFLVENNFRSIRHRLGLEDGVAEEAVEVEHSNAPFGPYKPIYKLEELREIAATARETGLLALSVQTDNPNGLHGNLVGLGVATKPGQGAYLPLKHHVTLDAEPQLPWDEAAEVLNAIFTDVAVLKIFHDAKFSLEALHRAGLATVAPLDDAMLISYAQDAGNFAQDLATLARVHLSHSVKSADDVTGMGRNRVNFAEAPVEKATAYAGEAADVVLRLWGQLKPALRVHKSLALYELLEKKLIPVLAEMEAAGVLVDKDDLSAMSAEFERRMGAFEKQIHKLAGHEFNVGSPKQLGEVLFEEMKLSGGKKGKTGAWGTDSSVLETLAEQGEEIAARVMDWRQLSKLKSTYADALVGQIDPKTGRVHTNFQMAATTTGRLSSTDPNLQNIPIRTEEGGRIRKAFIAAPGHSLVSADYSQIELRLLAHVADIPALKESFANGEDIHARTASEVFGVPMKDMDSATRRRAKAINFGIIYGISAFGLGRQLGISAGEAKSYIDAYFKRYPEIRAYMDNTKEQARTDGFVLTPFGRRCWVPRIKDKIPALRAYAERQAINAPLQGGAADIIKRAMVKLPKALKEAGLNAKLLLQVHDELLFEAPDDEVKAAAKLAQDVMQNAVTLSVPLVVETGIGKNWGKAH
ncbi:DNA polymerase I [Acidocella aminolytica]|uniref:DNA polymerase I n=1 Tax=Acidocella aminolytica 101 = DSM 11237 TaxID=1120923 RepID=A0A0D6PLV9_9PROT|nr:DNA polymerase I [Acidocella aminolytica]GAN81759.1 DNA polymerase I [Acidocella aminolytica 101 = DSM 11237]GBQ38990.1 DNA polymerase I [Acidocella aminolytica 101 = DSM 11237]SHF47097.1 DNA polymerase I [Acidocella aminolytica 101 = DSM 11237]